jgi:uncharacterized protein YjiS (DUF1127 family)
MNRNSFLRRDARHPMTRIFSLRHTWSMRTRQRSELAELPERALRDMGITRGQALAEAAKPFWRG